MEGKSQQERKKVRNKLGSLKGLTVQPRTRQRYTECLNRFFDWMEGLVLPKQQVRLDALVSGYLEHLWASGEGRSVANNTLAALQDRDPSLKKKLPGSWRLLKAWTTVEIPNRAPPMTLQILDALCGWSIFNGCPTFGLSLRIAFYGLLRTGELLSPSSPQFLHFVVHCEHLFALLALDTSAFGCPGMALRPLLLGEVIEDPTLVIPCLLALLSTNFSSLVKEMGCILYQMSDPLNGKGCRSLAFAVLVS